MTKQVQRRRGTASQHTSFTGAEGELSVNTTNKSVHVHDGTTAGGIEAARADLDNVSAADIASGISGGTVASLTITSADINGGTIDGATIGGSTAGAGTFTSATVTGNLTVGDNTVTPATDAGDLVVGGSTGNNGITIGAATTGIGSLRFADTGGTGRGIVLYDHSSDYMSFHAAGGERLRVTSDGRVGINTSDPEANLHIEGDGVSSLRFGNIGPSGRSSIRVSRDDTSVAAGNPLGYLEFGGNDSTSNIDAGFAYVSGEASGTHGAGDNPTDLTFGTTSSGSSTPQERMRIDSSGNLLVGATATSQVTGGSVNGAYLSGSGNSAFARNNTLNRAQIAFYNPNGLVGQISTSGSATIYSTSSDYRLKEDWQPMTGATERVKALNPVNFAWKVDGSRVDGFLAHEAQEVVPEAVTGEKDAMMDEEYEVTPAVLDEDGNVVTEAVMGTRQVPDYQGIDQSKLVPLLTAALQEAIAEIETLKTKVAALENA